MEKKNKELDKLEYEVKELRAYKRFVRLYDIFSLFALVIGLGILTYFYL